MSLGLRWDPFFPYTDETDRLGCYRPGEKSQVYVNAPVGVVYPGDAACPQGGYDASWADFGPRVGAAYDPFGDGKSSVRAGYGMYYDRPNTISTNSPANQAPFGTLVTFTGDGVNNMANPYAGRTNPFPADPFNVPADTQFFLPNAAFSYDPNLKNGRFQTWHVTLEREIIPTYLVRVAYAGSKGDRLAMGRELNAAVYATGATTATTQARRPLNPTFSTITTIESTGRSLYNSLQLTLDKRMSNRFSVLTSYTLSKSQDHAGEAKQTGTTQTNPFDLEFDWGYANADRRHRFVTSALWQIPGEFDNGVMAAVLSDWSLTGILAMQSGGGFTVTSGVDNARTGTGGQRADVSGDPTLSSDRSNSEKILKWFDTSVYAPNALGTFGNSARNSLRAPGLKNVDLGLHKSFATGGSTKLQVRIEAFNVFNWVNLNQPNTTQNSANFGRITERRRAARDAGRPAPVVLRWRSRASLPRSPRRSTWTGGSISARSIASSISSSSRARPASASAGPPASIRTSRRPIARPSSGARPTGSRPIARSSSASARRRCGRRSSSERPRSRPAAARCCCRCRCSSATSRTIWRRTARTSATRFARPACSTTSRTSRTRSRPARC